MIALRQVIVSGVLSMTLLGCARHSLPFTERRWDYERFPVTQFAAACSPPGNAGTLWGGWYFPNRAMARQFLNTYSRGGNTCVYDEVVLGCHPEGKGIAGFPYPIPMGACIPEFK